MKSVLMLLLLSLVASCAVQAQPLDARSEARAYRNRIAKWRKDQEADLKKDGGWLSVAGLFWLKEGENRLGTDPSCGVLLPPGSAPGFAGTLTLNEGRVTLHVADCVTMTRSGKPVMTQEMHSDHTGAPDRVDLGSLTLTVIQRGGRTGIRLYDKNSASRKAFHGMHWYPIDPTYCVTADFVPYEPPQTLAITNVLGDTQEVPCPGYVAFTLHGQTYRLEAQSSGNGLFFNFQDETSGETTYPAGRFLDAPKPQNGKVTLDFNQAVNPPCAFTTFATCPLPPRANRLAVRIAAGELTHHPGQESAAK